MKQNNSPIELVRYNNLVFYVKRDDLLDSKLNGNKARKLQYYLEKDMHDIDTIISYGGTQSNAMYAISELSKLKNKQFIYYTKSINHTIQINQNISNYSLAIDNGMQIIELMSTYQETVDNLLAKPNQIIIKQGGAEEYAKYGLQELANEINMWFEYNKLPLLNVFIPSGTGTSAIYLQQYLHTKINLYTTNCVGTANYLIQQWRNLGFYDNYPHIINNNKYRFANLYPKLLNTILDVQSQTNIEFDLLYDSVAFEVIMQNRDIFSNDAFLYIHCGGLIGNISMLERYKYKYNK